MLRWSLPLALLALGALAGLLLASAAWARPHGHRRHRAQAPVTQHEAGSVVSHVGIVAALAGGEDGDNPISYSHKDWLDRHAARFSGRDVRCDLCVRSASLIGNAEPGEAVIAPQIDMAALTRQLTTLEIAGSTVRVTSLSPFGLQFRKPF